VAILPEGLTISIEAAPRRSLTFTVLGDPRPKGSTRAFAIPIKGTSAKGGGPKYRAVTTSASKGLGSWEATVRRGAQEAVELEVVFGLQRPASVSEKARPYPSVTPDLDKLARGCSDPLTKVIWHDDAQVTRIIASKVYTAGPSYARITVRAIE
jgi:Holliday junction resolvase RusA-like endonuclease